jgi:hypothetical protein
MNMKMVTKKILVSAFATYFTFLACLMFFEPEIAGAVDGTTDVYLTVSSELTLACDASTTLEGTINSITGGTATNTFECNIKAPDTSGYNLTVVEDHTLQAATATTTTGYFADATTTIQYAWLAPGPGEEFFGYAMNTGTTAPATPYKGAPSACNDAGGTVNGANCWSGFALTTQKVVSSSSPSADSGDTASFMLKAQAGTSNFLTNGLYNNTITLTLTAGS